MLLTFEGLRLFEYCLSTVWVFVVCHAEDTLQSHYKYPSVSFVSDDDVELQAAHQCAVDSVQIFEVLEQVVHIVTTLLLGYWCVTCVEQFFGFHHFSFSSGYYLPLELLLPLPWDSSVTVVTRLRDERSRVQIPSGARDCSLRQKSTPYLGPPRWVPGIVPWSEEAGAWDSPLTQLVVRWRMSGAVPPLPLRSFLACAGTSKYFALLVRSCYFKSCLSYFI